jgi:hypothetical protein
VKIDKATESAVRAAYAGAVGGEPERFEAAVTAAHPNDEKSIAALTLALQIDATALYSIHEGWPDEEQIDTLTAALIADEDWLDIEESTVRRLLTALADEVNPLDTLPLGEAVVATYAIGAWLLSAFLDDNTNWTQFLDSILEKLETLPS